MRLLLCVMLFAASGLAGSVGDLLSVKRVYVDQLTGGVQADALRELIISSLDSTKLF
ncbi:MAG: hypothetical protein JOZ48_12995, partial [Acidobacteriaceae bacterium]|nr:hypothetical protein [Acidobacteriaceae bacterium]